MTFAPNPSPIPARWQYQFQANRRSLASYAGDVSVAGDLTVTGNINSSWPVDVFKGDPNGVLDAGVVLQAWFDGLPATGGALIIPNGVYKFTTNVVMASKPVNIQGETMMGVIFTSPNTTGDVITLNQCNGSIFANLSMTSSVVKTAGRFIYQVNCSHTTIRDLFMTAYYLAIQQENNALCYIINIQCNTPTPASVSTGGGAVLAGRVTRNSSNIYYNIATFAALASMPTFGLELDDADAPIIQACELIRHGNCLFLRPDGAGQFVNALIVSDTYCDSATIGILCSPRNSGRIISPRFTGCWSGNNTGQGTLINDTTGGKTEQPMFTNHYHFGNASGGFFAATACAFQIIGGISNANTGAGIAVVANCNAFTIMGCISGNGDTVGGGNTTWGIFVAAGTSNNYVIVGNNVLGNTTAGISDGGTGTGKRVHSNPGYVSFNSGTQVIAAGSTGATVTHGLAIAPTTAGVFVSPTTTWGSATKWWVDTITATQFTIRCDIAPGASFGFAWSARLAGSE